MILLLFLMSCSEEAHSPAFRGILQKLDVNHDECITVTECNSPDFEHFDVNQDGCLSEVEVEKWVVHADPEIRMNEPLPPPRRSPPLPPQQREFREVLLFEIEEIRAKNPDAPVPNDADIRMAVKQGPDSEVGKRVIDELRSAGAPEFISSP